MRQFKNIEIEGYPVDGTTFAEINTQIQQVARFAAATKGDNYIASGVKDIGANNYSDGWIVYNNEVLPFLGGAKGDDVTIVENTINREYEDNQMKGHVLDRYAKFGNDGVETFAFTSLLKSPLLLLEETNLSLQNQITALSQSLATLTSSFNNRPLPDWNQNNENNTAFINNKPSVMKVLAHGTENVGDPLGDNEVTVSFDNVGTTNYRVITEWISKGSANNDNEIRPILTRDKTANSFKAIFGEASSVAQDLSFEWVIFSL